MAEAESTGGEAQSRSRILVVDDNAQNLELIVAYLDGLDCDVETAVDGVDALEKVQAAVPDLILLDVMMPRMSGFEVCRKLKSDPQTRDVPVLMVTALNELGDIERGVESRTDDFLTKPVDIKTLFKVRSRYVDIVTVSVATEDAGSVQLDFLDTESGIKNMFGDTALYLEILYTFYSDYKNFAKQLELMLKVEEEEDIIIEIHTLKGLLATIGALDLHEMARELERKLRGGDFEYETFKGFIESFSKLLEQLNDYFNANPFQSEK